MVYERRSSEDETEKTIVTQRKRENENCWMKKVSTTVSVLLLYLLFLADNYLFELYLWMFHEDLETDYVYSWPSFYKILKR